MNSLVACILPKISKSIALWKTFTIIKGINRFPPLFTELISVYFLHLQVRGLLSADGKAVIKSLLDLMSCLDTRELTLERSASSALCATESL